MIRYEVFCQIHDYAEKHGLNVAQIARKLALDPKTVGKWINIKSFECGSFKTTPQGSKSMD